MNASDSVVIDALSYARTRLTTRVEGAGPACSVGDGDGRRRTVSFTVEVAARDLPVWGEEGGEEWVARRNNKKIQRGRRRWVHSHCDTPTLNGDDSTKGRIRYYVQLTISQVHCRARTNYVDM